VTPVPKSVAVVIATRDRPALLQGALEALARSVRAPDRLIVVDSGSVDPTVGEVASAAGATVVRCELPGLGRARNAGLAMVQEDVVAFTDDDCRPEPHWVASVAAAFGHPSRPAFVTGQVRPDAMPTARASMAIALTEKLQARLLGDGDDPRQFGHGANMAWRTDALRRIGNFDEAMGVGSLLRAGEDLDAFWRAVYHGGGGLFDPAVTVVHLQWRSRRANLRSYWGYGVGIGAVAVKRYRMEASADPRAARRGLRTRLLDEGIAPILRSVRKRYEMATFVDTVLFSGALYGARLAWRLPVADGHFVVPPARSLGRWHPGT
jgi:glycosyltransferase involved in cell wall biosynthesis